MRESSDVVKKLYQEIDDGLYKLREAKANHYTQEKFATDILDAALRRAKAEGWREAAKELRAKAKTIHDEAVTWGWGETAGQLSRLASTLDARAAQIEEGE